MYTAPSATGPLFNSTPKKMTKISPVPTVYYNQSQTEDSQILKIVLKFVNSREESEKLKDSVGGLDDEDTAKKKEMASAWRVVSFFVVVFVLPTILISVPLYARYQVYNAKTLYFTDGDMRSLHDGVSSFWCQGQRIVSNGSYVAYLTPKPKILRNRWRRSHIHSKVLLTEDDAEHWGIYLVRGSYFTFSTCSRWPGGALVVARGADNLRKCFYRENRVREELSGRHPSPKRVTRGIRRTIDVEDRQHSAGHRNAGGEVGDEEWDAEQEEFIRKFVKKSKKRKAVKGSEKEKQTKPNSTTTQPSIALTYSREHLNPDNTSELKYVKLSARSRPIEYILERDGDIVSVPWNDTVDVTAGNSSYSSSEEHLAMCKDTIHNIELMPYIDCPSMAYVSKHQRNITWRVRVNESDFYYFIFSSDNSIEQNTITFDMYIERKIFNVSSPISTCTNSTECIFPLKFLQSAGAIIDFNERYEQISTLEELQTYEVLYTCQPRSVVYTILIMLVPFIIILFAFR